LLGSSGTARSVLRLSIFPKEFARRNGNHSRRLEFGFPPAEAFCNATEFAHALVRLAIKPDLYTAAQ
jgi:hypothetical protein